MFQEAIAIERLKRLLLDHADDDTTELDTGEDKDAANADAEQYGNVYGTET